MTTTHTAPPEEHDAVVLGGGPAGSAAAVLLAGRGHGVALVRPTSPPAGDLAESIPPSADKILAELDLLDGLERAGFHRNGGNTVWWTGAPPRVEIFEGGRLGFHVDRAGLEAVFETAARTAGVRVLDGSAHAVHETEEGWTIRCRSDIGPGPELRTTWLLDATGRTGVVARREGRRPDASTNTLALVRRWRRTGGFPDAAPTHTLVESYPDGWAWSVPLDDEVRCFTAMVDPRHTDLSRAGLDASLDAELDKAVHTAALRADAEPVGRAWACPASLYTAERFGRAGLLLVGDAGSFIDPLSSFGVKKALSSGWLAGVTVHTALTDPAMGATAVAFFDEREREVYGRYRARSATFFEECARAYGHDYWVRRAEAAGRAGRGAAPAGDPDAWEAEVPAGDARQALDRIRALPTLDAVAGRSLHEVERPTVRGHRVVLARHLASEKLPRGLRWVRNVDLDRIVKIAPRHGDVPDGWAAYNAEAPSVTLPDYLAALATAFAAGLLEHSGDS